MRERIVHGLDTADTHHTANSFVLDPGGALYFQEGTFHHSQVEDAVRPADAARQRRRLPLRAADAEVRRLRLVTASPTRTATSSTAGARTSSSTAPARSRITRRSSPATCRLPAQARAAAAGLPAADAALPAAWRSSPASTSRTRSQGNLLVANVHRLPGHPAVQDLATTARSFGGRGTRADPVVERSELPPGRLQDRPGRRDLLHRLAEPDHRPHAAQPPRPEPRPDEHGRIYRVTYEGRPLLEAAEDRRRADREAAGAAQGPRGSRALPGARSNLAAARPRR